MTTMQPIPQMTSAEVRDREERQGRNAKMRPLPPADRLVVGSWVSRLNAGLGRFLS